jgi:hypothetical protein
MPESTCACVRERALAVVLAIALLQPENHSMVDIAPFNPTAEHPGGCYSCRYFGERRDPAVWCGKPGGEHLRSQADRGCAFWEREAGSDFDPEQEKPCVWSLVGDQNDYVAIQEQRQPNHP